MERRVNHRTRHTSGLIVLQDEKIKVLRHFHLYLASLDDGISKYSFFIFSIPYRILTEFDESSEWREKKLVKHVLLIEIKMKKSSSDMEEKNEKFESRDISNHRIDMNTRMWERE